MKYWIVKYGDNPLVAFTLKKEAKKYVNIRKLFCFYCETKKAGLNIYKFYRCNCHETKEYSIHEVNEKVLEKGKI